MKEKTYTVEKCLFEDILEVVLVELAEKAEKWEIPKWGSYDVDQIENAYPARDYHVSLHEGPVEDPGEVVATAYIHTVEGEDTAEVTVSWEEGYVPLPIRLEGLQYNRLHQEAFNTSRSKAEIIREALELYWEGGKNTTEKRFFIVNPDSGSYDKEFFVETVEYLSGEFDVDAIWTGKTRDTGYGQEKEFLIKGKREDVELFVSRLEDACHI